MTADEPRSIAFDRAATYYDRSRAISEEAMAANIDVLSNEMSGRGRVLEVGVGTGLIALPLAARGLPVVGIDLSAPMLAALAEKAEGKLPPFVFMADATRLPFPDASFGGAYLRWVLHLIPAWKVALAEMDRVVGPEGIICINLGAYGGVRIEIQDRFSEITGIDLEPVGLGWGAVERLDEAMAAQGRRPRVLPVIHESGTETVQEFLDGIRDDRFSWTWKVPKEVRMDALEKIRPWAEARFGALDRPRDRDFATQWRAYDPAETPANPP